MSPRPVPRRDRPACPDEPLPDEIRVLVLGLDGLTAALAVQLLRCGVRGLNVADPAPVAASDLRTGAYRPSDAGRTRETALRRRLRDLDPRCVPVSAPELFPGALLPGTVVVRGVEHFSSTPGGRVPPEPWPVIDPRHRLVSLHRVDGLVLRWPTVPWGHRPCPDCVRSTLGARGPGAVAPRGEGARRGVLAEWAGPAHAAAVAGRLAVEVLAEALGSLGSGPGGRPDAAGDRGPGDARVFAPPWPEPVARLRPDRSRCLCGLAQE